METDKAIKCIIHKIKKAGGGSSTRMEYAFRQELPIVMKRKTYEAASDFANVLAKKANLDRTPKIFRHGVSPKKDGIRVFNQKKNYQERIDILKFREQDSAFPLFNEITVKEEEQKAEIGADVINILKIAGDMLDRSNGADSYFEVAKNLLEEARGKIEMGDAQ